jgi:hypothetical protein
MDWIEQLFGIAPDNGSGTLEAFISAAAVSLVTALVFRRYVTIRRSRDETGFRR